MKKSSTKVNIIYQVIYDILLMILPFLTSPYVARVLGANGLGIYSYYYSIATYFVLFSQLGIKNYGNRIIAKHRDNQEEVNELFSNLTTIHIIISLICVIVYISYIFTVNSNEKIYAIIMLAQVLSGLFDISWFYFGIEHFKLTVLRSTVIKILNVICVFTLVRSKSDLWIYCLIMALGMLLSQLTLWVPLKKYVKFVKPSWSKMTIHIKPMLVLFVPTIAVSLYKYMDKIMIGSISSKTQLGFYENAEKVINIPTTVITSFGTVMLPKMSNMMARKDKSEALKYTGVSMLYVMWLAYALTFGLAGVASIFAPVFWGDEFQLSGSLIMGLAATIPFMSFANVIRTQYLIPAEKDKEFMVSVVSGSVVNLIINALLIPKYGSVGATVGTIVAEVTVCFIQCYAVRKELRLWQYFSQTLFFLGAGAVMFFVIFKVGKVLGEGVVTLFIQICLGGILYCMTSFIYLYAKREVTFMSMLQSIKGKINK